MADNSTRYSQLIEVIFSDRFVPDAREIPFERADIVEAARQLDIELPKNLGDVIYTFRYRADLPVSIVGTAPAGYEWVIRAAGRGRYNFTLSTKVSIEPSSLLAETKIPDATPGVIVKYALNDEQSLLASIRYNRLIDIFLGLTCYSLQNHLRTTVRGMGQVETDEVYVGLDKRGVHFVIPVQAKGIRERLGIVQIEQDIALCKEKFANLVCIPVAAQFMPDDVIALFAFEESASGVVVTAEKHYRLALADAVSTEELLAYQRRPV